MDRVSTVGVSTTSTVLTQKLGVMTQHKGTTILIYPDFYLPGTLDSRLPQMHWQTLTRVSADGNLVAVIAMQNLVICHLIDTYAVDRQNGKIYAICSTRWCLILEQTKPYPFIVLPPPTSVPWMQFHLTLTGTTLPVY